MDIVGLAFELLFLCGGIYLYLFSIGRVESADPEKKKQGEDFRAKNKWLRPVSLAMIAIMSINILFHIKGLFS